MNLFITGTDTGVGKTVIASWLALHLKAEYWKPIQTGAKEGRDADTVFRLSQAPIFPESYLFQAPLFPLAAAALEKKKIDFKLIQKPSSSKLIIEGAGGVFVPITNRFFMIDLIKTMRVPVIVVARTALGTINHTCLTIEALKNRNIPILGVILNGSKNEGNKRAIEKFGKVQVLEELEPFKTLSYNELEKRKTNNKLIQSLINAH